MAKKAKPETIDAVRDYLENLCLDDYDLGGVEITDDDIRTIASRYDMYCSMGTERSVEVLATEYLVEIREVLDMGLLDDECESDLED